MRYVCAAFIASLALSIGACSSDHKTTTISTGNGTTATVDTTTGGNGSGGTTTVTTNQGTVSMGQGAVDTSKIGIPIYPGATAGNGGWSVQSKQSSGQVVSLTTSDSFSKVEAWYKTQLGSDTERMNVTEGNTSSAVFQVGKESDADQKSIEITSDGTKTTIVLSHKTTAPSPSGS